MTNREPLSWTADDNPRLRRLLLRASDEGRRFMIQEKISRGHHSYAVVMMADSDTVDAFCERVLSFPTLDAAKAYADENNAALRALQICRSRLEQMGTGGQAHTPKGYSLR